MKKVVIKQQSNISFGGGNITFDFNDNKPIKEVLQLLIDELNEWSDTSLKRIKSITIN